jgi:signal transduction histidine kinase
LLRVAVRDHGPGVSGELGDDEDAAGFGLLGMGERVEAISGTFTAGDHPDGGFEIVADLPAGGTS